MMVNARPLVVRVWMAAYYSDTLGHSGRSMLILLRTWHVFGAHGIVLPLVGENVVAVNVHVLVPEISFTGNARFILGTGATLIPTGVVVFDLVIFGNRYDICDIDASISPGVVIRSEVFACLGVPVVLHMIVEDQVLVPYDLDSVPAAAANCAARYFVAVSSIDLDTVSAVVRRRAPGHPVVGPSSFNLETLLSIIRCRAIF